MTSLYRKIKHEKLFLALAVVIWLFLLLTTISKSYFYVLRSGGEVEAGYLILRAFLIWGILAIFSPLFIKLAKRFPLEGTSYFNIGLHIFFSLIFVPLHAVLYRSAIILVYDIPFTGSELWDDIPSIMSWLGIIGPLSYWLIIGAFNLRKYYEQYKERQLRNMEMRAELASIRLHVLKVQLHPHFLFNTLHNINSLIHESPNTAKRVLILLKRFLQISINRVDQQKVPLMDELEFTGTYLAIERTRFSNRLTIETDIDKDTLEAEVPSFLLQPLVENAVKHGISKKLQPGILKITSQKQDRLLRLMVEDNGPGLSGTVDSGGVGLENIRQRLTQLYSEASFELLPSELGGLKVQIEIPLSYSVNPNGQDHHGKFDTNYSSR